MFQGKWRLVFKQRAEDQDVLSGCSLLFQSSWTEDMRRFDEFAKELARKIAGVEILVHYVFDQNVPLDGSYVVHSTYVGTVIINVGFLGERWFRKDNWKDHVGGSHLPVGPAQGAGDRVGFFPGCRDVVS